ncbi:hypothetical protein P7C73_g1459, partial [Tremellales sp. Uapishka_1]
MPPLGLPPLPRTRVWSTHFPRRLLPLSPDIGVRINPSRVLLANQRIADEFVRALDLRKDEVVLEAYAGVGCITRSLVGGGRSKIPQEGEVVQSIPFPSWNTEELDTDVHSRQVPISSPDHHVPALVIANEPSFELLVRGLGLDPASQPASRFSSEAVKAYLNLAVREAGQDSPSADSKPPSNWGNVDPLRTSLPVVPSTHQSNLLLSPTSPYLWTTLPRLLAHEKVTPYISKREWRDEAPHITLVAQLPDSVVGEQLTSQWIGSAVGNDTYPRNWIWAWGRINLGLMVGKGLYDRLMARPGDLLYCKLTVMANALFHVTPLPPYHHVVNIDKNSRSYVAGHPDGKRAEKPRKTKSKASPQPQSEPAPTPDPSSPEVQVTPTYPTDFYPIHNSSSIDLSAHLPRPVLLGVKLVPRVDSIVDPEQKDSWDFVLRKCFVKDKQPLRDALKNLSIGAENLVAKIEDRETTVWKGVAVDTAKSPRDLTYTEWLRVVDVFDRWAFRPPNLILDSVLMENSSRQMDQD